MQICPDDEDKPDSRYTWILQNCEITKFVTSVRVEAFFVEGDREM